MSVELRLARLEAAEQIRNLKGRYCDLCDTGYAAEELAALFTEDAVWDGGPELGRHAGRAAIRAFFERMPAMLSFAIHHATNPQITVSADTTSATGRWCLLQVATSAADGQAFWFAATYDDTYVRVDDGWLFASVQVTSHFVAPYERGWAQVAGRGEPG
jgi:ketosteroid isomerase-like protein